MTLSRTGIGVAVIAVVAVGGGGRRRRGLSRRGEPAADLHAAADP